MSRGLRVRGTPHGRMRAAFVWLMQTAMAALLLFLLWHPALSVATLKPQQNIVAVVVDDSGSMAMADEGGSTPQRRGGARSELRLIKDLQEQVSGPPVPHERSSGAHREAGSGDRARPRRRISAKA